MTSKLVYNVESAGPSRLESLGRHCRKRSPDGASNLDPTRSHLNRTLVGDPASLSASLQALYDSGVRRPARQAEAPYLRLVVSASPQYFRPTRPDAAGTWDDPPLSA